MRYRVLGPVEVVGDDGPVALRSASQRLLLALLLAAWRLSARLRKGVA